MESALKSAKGKFKLRAKFFKLLIEAHGGSGSCQLSWRARSHQVCGDPKNSKAFCPPLPTLSPEMINSKSAESVTESLTIYI